MARILIVDDSESVLISLRWILRGESHEVVTAASGAEGLAILQEQHIDLLITDIYMPPPDGLEVMRKLREQKLNIPVIAISSRPPPLNMFVPARGLGARISLQKPFSSASLLDAVEAVLDESRGSNRLRQFLP